MIQSVLNAVKIFDRTNVPMHDRLYFDGESIIELNSDRQVEKKKVITKLPKRAKRRVRGAERGKEE